MEASWVMELEVVTALLFLSAFCKLSMVAVAAVSLFSCSFLMVGVLNVGSIDEKNFP